jgi:hypothetical protein
MSGASKMRVGALGICLFNFARVLDGRIVSESSAARLVPDARGESGSRSSRSVSLSWKLRTRDPVILERGEPDPSAAEKLLLADSPAGERARAEDRASAFGNAGDDKRAARSAELNSVCALVGATGVARSFSSASAVR